MNSLVQEIKNLTYVGEPNSNLLTIDGLTIIKQRGYQLFSISDEESVQYFSDDTSDTYEGWLDSSL